MQQQISIMKQLKQNRYCFFIILALLCLGSCIVPPYIHKFPLTLTKNYVYYAQLYFGQDRQNISLLVDTGSKTLAIFCSLCSQGCELEEEFIVENSTTFMNVTCGVVDQFFEEDITSPALNLCKSNCRIQHPENNYHCKGQLNYGSSAISTFLDYLLIRDLISVEEEGLQVNSTFGCIYDESGFESGIWGVALSPDNALLDKIHRADKQKGYTEAKKIFTICTADGKAVMNIGGIDGTNHIGDGVTMNVVSHFDLWWNINPLQIGKITYNGQTVRGQHESFGQYGIILDSGTDFIILPTRQVNTILQTILDRCQSFVGCTKTNSAIQIFNNIFQINNPEEFFQGQIITWTFKQKKLDTPLSNYFWNMGNGVWIFAVVSAQEINFNMAILGSIWMNNFDIAFDRENQSITIYDITSCDSSKRRLQSEDSSDYDLPKEREDMINGAQSINRLRMKHQKGIAKMINEKKGV